MMIRSLTLSTFLCGAAFAQVGGPVLGFLPEGASIRSMYGLPAAGAIGGVVRTGHDFSQVAISPQQNFAIATDASTGDVMIVNLLKASQTAISGAGVHPDMLAISPSGTSAALWFSSLNRMQIVSGLPDSPSVATVDASFLTASPTAITVSDDGQWVAALSTAGAYAFGPSAKVINLQTDPGVLTLSFFHNSHNLALATAARATSIADLGGSMQPSILFDYSAQSLSPRAIGLSFDNQRAVIADTSGKIVNINIANSTANTVDCGCNPQGVYGLGGSVFRLNGTGGAQRNALERGGSKPDLKLFDAAAGAVLIVPPALVAETGGRQ